VILETEFGKNGRFSGKFPAFSLQAIVRSPLARRANWGSVDAFPRKARSMLRFLKLLLIAPFAILFLVFAFANGQFVTVSFDPLASGDVPAYSIEARMFIVLTVAIMIGVVAGGVATWFGQGKHRRAARMYRAEADRLHGELQAAKASLAPPLNAVKRA
jgi:hypothetical protein